MGTASNRVGNAYNHVGIVPNRLDTFQPNLKRFQEGWKCFWVIFETLWKNSQVSDVILSNYVGICPITLESVQLRWNTMQDESVQLCWNLSNYVGILRKFYKLLA